MFEYVRHNSNITFFTIVYWKLISLDTFITGRSKRDKFKRSFARTIHTASSEFIIIEIDYRRLLNDCN